MDRHIDSIILASLEKHLAMTADDIENMQNPEDDGLYDMLSEICSIACIQEFYVVGTSISLQFIGKSSYSTDTKRYIFDNDHDNRYCLDGESLCAA